MTTVNKRTTLTLELRPIAGSRFQPTGFPDLGAATFERPGLAGEQLLVESVQSMANHLEATTWDHGKNAPIEAVAALPYVRVVDGNGEFLTSSRLEAHRLASAYVLDSTLDSKDMRKVLEERLGLVKGKPLDAHRVASAVFSASNTSTGSPISRSFSASTTSCAVADGSIAAAATRSSMKSFCTHAGRVHAP